MAGRGVNWLPWRRPGRPPSSSSSAAAALRRRRKVRSYLCGAGRSLLAFGAGLTLASCYGATALFLEGAPLWTCVYSTLAVAAAAAFGMGMSVRVRGAVGLMMPALCSGQSTRRRRARVCDCTRRVNVCVAQGRNFLLLASTWLLVSGPVANTLENAEQAAASLLCGAELAANQTRQLMRNAATPLLAALDHIRQMGSNAAAMATRVNKLIGSVSDAIRQIGEESTTMRESLRARVLTLRLCPPPARTVRNVLHYLVDIGNVCDSKMGLPYAKCRAIFKQARVDCNARLGNFKHLCKVVSDFMRLCNLAKAPEVFCLVPEYVGTLLQDKLADSTIAAFQRMRRQFDFNLSVSADLEADADVSRSLRESGQGILEQLSGDLKVLAALRGPLVWAGLVLLTYSLIRAVHYQHKYLTHLNFDNVYISAQFVELDCQLTSEGGASVLPITRRESQLYIRPLALRLTRSECRSVLVGVASVCRHALISAVLVALDFLVFWLLDQVHRQVRGGVVARAPVKVSILVEGLGYMADIMRDLVASFNLLQAGNVTVISSKCLRAPSQPDYAACFTLGFLLGAALLVAFAGGMVQRSRRLICAYFHPDTERVHARTPLDGLAAVRPADVDFPLRQARIRFLRQQILDERRAAGRALVRASARKPAGGAGPCGRLGALCARLPGGDAYLSQMCLACGEGAGLAPFICDVRRCPGVFCKACFKRVGGTCDVCARPATFQEDSQEEPDSSEDERGRV
ncbi:DC-STAMP domain-containing protein 2 isoform X2 [Vanacampus margaritifer]